MFKLSYRWSTGSAAVQSAAKRSSWILATEEQKTWRITWNCLFDLLASSEIVLHKIVRRATKGALSCRSDQIRLPYALRRHPTRLPKYHPNLRNALIGESYLRAISLFPSVTCSQTLYLWPSWCSDLCRTKFEVHRIVMKPTHVLFP